MALYRISRKELDRSPLTQKTIILDLDETLVHSSEDPRQLLNLSAYKDKRWLELRSRMYRFSLDGYEKRPTIWGVTRPHLEEFLPFCFGYFEKVCVWSAGIPKYVAKVVEHIFPSGYEPYLVYNRNHCYYAPSGDLFKPIEAIGHREIRLDNTLFVDDRPTTFYDNPDNGIIIPAYQPEGRIEDYIRDERSLYDLMNWLMRPEVIKAKDVRLLEKRNIFSYL